MDNITLTRKDTRDTVSLPPDMRWLDEYGWAAVAQAEPEYTLGGAIVVQQGVKHTGRPITLGGEWAWLDWQTVQTLRSWCDVPELEMTLQLDNDRRFDVIFRLHERGLDNVTPIRYAVPEKADDRYTAEIRLMTA